MRIQLLLIIFILGSFKSYAAKKECTALLEKLHIIQSKQRQGQSLNNSIKLREKEDAARQKWWACENNKLKPKSKKQKTVKSTKKRIKLKNNKREPIEAQPQVFSANGNIMIKGRFSGEKQFHWLEYYKQPEKCLKPKTTQVFAFCMEDKTAQQHKFEQEYNKKKN